MTVSVEIWGNSRGNITTSTFEPLIQRTRVNESFQSLTVPIGILYESVPKPFIFSPYGKEKAGDHDTKPTNRGGFMYNVKLDHNLHPGITHSKPRTPV